MDKPSIIDLVLRRFVSPLMGLSKNSHPWLFFDSSHTSPKHSVVGFPCDFLTLTPFGFQCLGKPSMACREYHAFRDTPLKRKGGRISMARCWNQLSAKVLLLTLVAIALSACESQKELLGGLSAKQSVEVLVTLSNEKIPSDREKTSSGRGGVFRILVFPKDFERALKVVHQYGLPRVEGPQLEEFIKPQSFAPSSPGMSNLRLDYALGLQVERMLTALPGAVDAKVIIRANLSDEQSTFKAKPSATVVLRYSSPSNRLPFSAADVQKIVADAVPGITPEAVQIQLSRVYTPSDSALFNAATDGLVSVIPLTRIHGLFNFRVADEDRQRALLQMVIYLFLFCFCGLAIGFIWGGQVTKQRLAKRARRGPVSPSGSKSFFIEASYGGQSPSKKADTGRYLTENKK